MCSMYLATLGNVYNVSVHHFQLGMSSLIHDSWLVGFKRNYNPLQHTIIHYSWVRQFGTNLCRDVSISSCRHTQIMEHISLFLFQHNFISGSPVLAAWHDNAFSYILYHYSSCHTWKSKLVDPFHASLSI